MNSNGIKEVNIEIKWKEVHDLPPPSIGPFYTLMNYADQPTERLRTCQLTVFVQGNLDRAFPLGELQHELVFLTVHDVGTNPQNSFIQFVNSPPMASLKEKSIFLHTCVPGQEPGAPDYHEEFPTISQLAQMLPQVLEHFGITRCVVLGEGAGADIVCRFAMENADLVAGAVFIHCTSTTHGILENLKEIFANLRIEEGKMDENAWDYLVAHKLGEKQSKESRKHFIGQIHANGLNEHNLSKYLHAFANRDDFTDHLEKHSSKFNTILVTGGQSPHNKNIFHMFDHMDKSKTGLMVAEGVVDILAEAPEYLCETLKLLCQRHIHVCPNILPESIKPEGMEVGEQKAKSFALIPPNPSPMDGRSTPLAKPAIHRDHPQPTNNMAMDVESKTNSVPSMANVPRSKPTKLIGFPAAIPQNPVEFLPEKYAQQLNSFPAQNPADILPSAQMLIPSKQSMSKCGSSLSQLSNFQCQHCGKECCWCRELAPGSPLE